MYRQSRYIVFFILSLLLAVSHYARGQSAKGKDEISFANTWLVGASIGPDFFYGDLSPHGGEFGKNISIAGSIFGGRQFTNVVGLRGQFLFAGLRGRQVYESGSEQLNLSFAGSLAEFNINTTINFSNLFSPFKPSRRFFVYGTLGIGVAAWNTKLTDLTTMQVITNDSIPQWRASAVFPFGLGAFYRIGDRINVGVEWTFRMAFSDYVDQIAGNFKYDFYDYLAFGVTINLGKLTKKSPRVKEYPYPVSPVQTNPPRPKMVPLEILQPVANVSSSLQEEYDYVVQIFAFAKTAYRPETIRKRYHIAQPVIRERVGKLNRYIVGKYKNLENALELRDEMLKKGIHDAFVVAYKNGQRDHTIPNNR